MRLQTQDKGGEPFQISFRELLPLHDYFIVIDKHHALRLKLFELKVPTPPPPPPPPSNGAP